MSGSVYSTLVHIKGTFPSRAAATSLAIEAGAAAAAGLVSRGLPLSSMHCRHQRVTMQVCCLSLLVQQSPTSRSCRDRRDLGAMILVLLPKPLVTTCEEAVPFRLIGLERAPPLTSICCACRSGSESHTKIGVARLMKRLPRILVT